MDTLLAVFAPWMAPAFSAWGVPVTWLELVAFALAVAMVVCNIRVVPWGWPLAIVSSMLYFLLFWQSKLYGDACLQLFFAAVAGWGWWQWLYGKRPDGQRLTVHALPRAGRWAIAAGVLLAWPLLGTWLARTTDSDVPYWDAFPTVASVAGQFLLGRKLIENWPTWVVVNIVSVGLFAYKGLWLTVLLYALFVVMSVLGWRAWQRLRQAPAVAA